MWIFDHQTLRFIDVNPAAVAKYGYSRQEFLRMKIIQIRPKDQVPILLAGLRPFCLAGTHVTERQHLTKDQKLIDVEITASQLYFKERPAVLVEARDITEYKKEIHALIQAGNEIIAQLKAAQALIAHHPAQAVEFTNRALWIAKRNVIGALSSREKKSSLEIATMLACPLTLREIQVLHLLTAGKSNKEIAAQLELSEGTIKIHVHHILRKLGTAARTEAAMLAVKLGIVHI